MEAKKSNSHFNIIKHQIKAQKQHLTKHNEKGKKWTHSCIK